MAARPARSAQLCWFRLAELAGWDREILKIELQGLAALDLDFDVEITGFDTAELDLLLDDRVEATKPDSADEIPPLASGPSITRPGDLWLMGEHRLLCGDARDGAVVQRLMDRETARMVFTDPPYNVKIDGHVGGAGKIKHREFAMASGEMSQDQFTRFLTEVLRNMADASCDGSIHFVCMDWRHMSELMTAGGRVYDELKNLVVWTKTNGGMGTRICHAPNRALAADSARRGRAESRRWPKAHHAGPKMRQAAPHAGRCAIINRVDTVCDRRRPLAVAARTIRRAVRYSGGRVPGCRAVGVGARRNDQRDV